MRIFSFSPFGYEGSLVSVEVDLRRGIPAVDMVGLADGAVRESRERMRAAINNSGFEFPPERVLISLSPADLRKEGAGFDLPIAIAVLDAKRRYTGMLPIENSIVELENDTGYENSVLVMGELELSGGVRPVRGVHAALATAVENGIKYCIVPKENMMEALGLPGMIVYAAETLVEAFHALERLNAGKIEKKNSGGNEFCSNIEFINSQESENISNKVVFNDILPGYEFNDIKNQSFFVRGLQIAAAGAHNLFVYGPPGCGKTMALQKFPALLPLLTNEEARPVTRIYSIAGLMPPGQPLVKQPPFRMPHQSASLEGISGGGNLCNPGEISLAHNGVLFLDEAGEFRTSVLQSLRVPLESGKISLSRAGRHTVYPAEFQLLAATNPCPCGNFGSNDKICLCSARSVEQYWKKFSAPLLDRIDIRVPLFSKDENVSNGISTKTLRKAIGNAVYIQRSRQKKRNARLTAEELPIYCQLDKTCNNFLCEEAEKNGFSPRAVHACIKLARTIADMDLLWNYDEIEKEVVCNGKKEMMNRNIPRWRSIKLSDLEEAVSYRKNEGGINLSF